MAPNQTVYKNLEQVEVVRRNNCGTGMIGSEVVVRVEAALDEFDSIISQADANAKAKAYLDSIKQTFANTAGVCTSEWQRTGNFRCKGSNNPVGTQYTPVGHPANTGEVEAEYVNVTTQATKWEVYGTPEPGTCPLPTLADYVSTNLIVDPTLDNTWVTLNWTFKLDPIPPVSNRSIRYKFELTKKGVVTVVDNLASGQTMPVDAAGNFKLSITNSQGYMFKREAQAYQVKVKLLQVNVTNYPGVVVGLAESPVYTIPAL
jgi:hypothetical protein